MSIAEPKSADVPEEDQSKRLLFSISGLRFSGGDAIQLDPGDLLVLVGPNNSGKSSALREIRSGCGNERTGPVLQSCDTLKAGDAEALLNWLEEHTSKESDGTYRWINAAVSVQNLEAVWTKKQTQNQFTNMFVSLADTQNRLSVVRPQAAPGSGGPPAHPFHVLFHDFDRDRKLSEFFRRAFGKDLILQRAGAKTQLYCGDRTVDGDGIESTVFQLIKDLPKLPSLDTQGDGMRSFVGALLHLLTSPGFVHLVDEPEAFLHPPQAREMGRIIAEIQHGSDRMQTVVATHSGDFLRGVIEFSPKHLKVARITRSAVPEVSGGDVNNIRSLNVAELAELWKDPVLRFSHALDAVFHEACLICEYEADCQFYSSLADVMGAGSEAPDTMYVGSGGIGGMPKLIGALTALGLPTAAIVDFDVLRKRRQLKELVLSFGAEWEPLDQLYESFSGTIDAKVSAAETESRWEKIASALEEDSEHALPQETIAAIRLALKTRSPWEELKRLGLRYLQGGTLKTASQLVDALAELGIYVVPVGEMESFAAEFRTGGIKGSRWVANVLRNVSDLATDTRLSDAREFISRVQLGLARMPSQGNGGD